MKKTFLFLVFICVSMNGVAALPDLDDVDIRKQFDMRSFLVGKDFSVGEVYYIIDRTLGLCFVSFVKGINGGGINLVDCESLKKNPVLKKYIESGKVDAKINPPKKGPRS